MRTLRIISYVTASTILVLSAVATHAWADQRVALVIGNASYAHATSLANPLNDATDIGAALDRLGFAVKPLDNAGYTELRRGLQQFSLAASASEMAVVFYVGHGIEVGRRNFLIPVDARLQSGADVEFEAVPLDLLSRAVERAKGLRCCSVSSFDPSESMKINALPRRSTPNRRAEQHHCSSCFHT